MHTFDIQMQEKEASIFSANVNLALLTQADRQTLCSRNVWVCVCCSVQKTHLFTEWKDLFVQGIFAFPLFKPELPELPELPEFARVARVTILKFKKASKQNRPLCLNFIRT